MTRFSPGFLFPRAAMTAAFKGSTSSSANATIYTFSALDFGATNSGRYILACVSGGGNSRTISSVTIGGVAATLVSKNTATNNPAAAMYIALVPDDGSGTDIVVTFSAGELRAAVSWYRITNLNSATPVDANHTENGNPPSISLGSSAGGFGFALAAFGSSTANVTWSNATEDSDIQVESALVHSVASGATAGGSFDPSASRNTINCMVAATFR